MRIATLRTVMSSRTDYFIPQTWKRFLFRRGYMPMGDMHDIMDHMKPLLDEAYVGIAKRHTRGGDISEFQKAYNRESFNEFMKIFEKEAEKQWDRIVDRRFNTFLYSIVANFAFTILGFILGRV